MAAEGEFPKINGDTLYASEVNQFANTSVPTGTGTASSAFTYTNGSGQAFTDGLASPVWTGSTLGAGSIVVAYPYARHVNQFIFDGDITYGPGTGGASVRYILAVGSGTSFINQYDDGLTPISTGEVTTTKLFSIGSPNSDTDYKYDKLRLTFSNTNGTGSVSIKVREFAFVT